MAGATGDSINRSDSFPPALVLQGLPCSAWRGERVRVMLLDTAHTSYATTQPKPSHGRRSCG